MSRDRSLLLALVGGFALWLVASGNALYFVRPGMRVWVVAAGVVVVALALLPEGHGAHDHAHGVGVGWLLVLPVLVGVLVPPRPLGSGAVSSRLGSGRASSGVYPPLAPAEDGAVPMSMAEFATRALRDTEGSVRGVPVRLLGFVAAPPSGGTYRLGRFVIFCCAADAEAVEVTVVGDGAPRRRDEWLSVVGVWDEAASRTDVPALRVTSVSSVKRPGTPYEYTTVWSG